MIGFIWEFFLIYLQMLWPPNLYQFLRHWREPLHGQGLGPGFYRLFLPVYFTVALCALVTDVALIGLGVYGGIYLSEHLVWTP
jgi:hypothetical protein